MDDATQNQQLLASLRSAEIAYHNRYLQGGWEKEYFHNVLKENARAKYRYVYFASKIEFSKAINIQRLEEAVHALLSEQELLRSVFVEVDSVFKWRTFKPPTNITLPFLDLSSFSESFIKAFIYEVLFAYYANKDRLSDFCFRCLLLKFGPEEYRFFFLINESIHDQYSEDIVRRSILSHYQQVSSSPETTTPNYEQYLQTLERGPQNISPEKLIAFYQLAAFQEATQRLQEHIPPESNCSFKLQFPLRENGDDLNKWELALRLLKVFCQKYIPVTPLPLLVETDCRGFDNYKYINTMGNFSDFMPIVLDINADFATTAQTIQQKVKFASQHNINFMQLFLNEATTSSIQKEQRLLRELLGNLMLTKTLFIFRFNAHFDKEKNIEVIDNEKYNNHFKYPAYLPRWGCGYYFYVSFDKGKLLLEIHAPISLDENDIQETLHSAI